VPAELVESELFGHEKGAFSGAVAQRRGRFEQADGGTLFLDEIGDMAAPMQAKLLRVLQDGEIARVGGTGEIKVDVRVISATNHDLDALVADGRFREDLYYRINTLSLRTPALREHAQDIPALAAHFAAAAVHRHHWRPRRLSPEALAVLQEQPWKGNVRELRNVVERLSVLSEDGEVPAAEVALYLPAVSMDDIDTALISLDDIERRHVLKVLQHCAGNRARAAKILGVDPKTLYNKLKSYHLDDR